MKKKYTLIAGSITKKVNGLIRSFVVGDTLELTQAQAERIGLRSLREEPADLHFTPSEDVRASADPAPAPAPATVATGASEAQPADKPAPADAPKTVAAKK